MHYYFVPEASQSNTPGMPQPDRTGLGSICNVSDSREIPQDDGGALSWMNFKICVYGAFSKSCMILESNFVQFSRNKKE